MSSSDTSTSKILRWEEFDRGVFLVNLLAIVYDPSSGTIIIGRREKDPYIEELSWCFPGGRPAYEEELEEYLKSEVKKKTNLDIDIEKVLFAKTYPENRKFLSIYYLARAKNVGEEKAGEKFVEIKWVKPTDVVNYFTTSIHPQILKLLEELERKFETS
jgi:ADP-ribose pyrophosphatase YjhB (NUDIX family)